MPVSSTNTNIPQKPEKNNAPGTKTRGKEGMSMKFRFTDKERTLAVLRMRRCESEEDIRECKQEIQELKEEIRVAKRLDRERKKFYKFAERLPNVFEVDDGLKDILIDEGLLNAFVKFNEIYGIEEVAE